MAAHTTLELPILVKTAAGPPHSWSAEALDKSSVSQGLDAHGIVKCGQYFTLEISALDIHNNRSLSSCHLKLSLRRYTITWLALSHKGLSGLAKLASIKLVGG